MEDKKNMVEANNEANGAVLSAVMHENEQLKARVAKMVEMTLSYQWYIPAAPVNKTQLYGQACANDAITVKTWAETWLKNIEANAKYGFHENSAMQEYKKQAMKPVIIAGSGPSLKRNANLLKDRGDICLVSCLHNFGLFEDLGIKPDYYLNLDAGDITIDEVSEFGTKPSEFYWERTAERTLLTATHCNPKLHEKWKGKKLWFSTIIPDRAAAMEAMRLSKDFPLYFQCGGNALGACLYFARAVLGGCPIAFVGADFAFDYTHKFHPTDTKYDAQFAGVVPATDVYGNRVYTWQSYYNFKNWFEFISMGGEGNNPQLFFNCTEGGILGAYHEGNVINILQMPLEMFLKTYRIYEHMENCVSNRMFLF